MHPYYFTGAPRTAAPMTWPYHNLQSIADKYGREKRTKSSTIMRITSIFLLLAMMSIYASGISQNITITAKNEPLKTVLKKIAAQAGVYIVYEEKELITIAPVSLQVKDVSLKQALDLCFKDQPLSYSIIGKTVAVKKKELIKDDFSAVPPPQEKLLRVLGRVLEAKDPPGPL